MKITHIESKSPVNIGLNFASFYITTDEPLNISRGYNIKGIPIYIDSQPNKDENVYKARLLTSSARHYFKSEQIINEDFD